MDRASKILSEPNANDPEKKKQVQSQEETIHGKQILMEDEVNV